MRLWTLHPRYLDPQGLVALWREGLLARAVLRGKTKGYKHHPQLRRFQQHASPVAAVNAYLSRVADEADARGYSFDRSKLGGARSRARLSGTSGQMALEWRHLLDKLRRRSPALYRRWRAVKPRAHPLFRIARGPVADWERSSSRAKSVVPSRRVP
jgi:hypothetical protein